MKIAKRNVTFEDSLLAAIFDKVSLILWTKTKDATRGRNKPKSLFDALENPKEPTNYTKFGSIEEFEKRRAEIMGVE